MNIELQLAKIPEITRIDSDSGRMYKTPDGNMYPSVSTVLGKGIPNPWIDEWRKKVGDKVANEISKRATDRGTLIHENIENTILGKPLTFNMFQQEDKMMYKQVLPVLDDITIVRGLETQMWSDKLRVAGTVDCIAVHNGKLKCIDWKTSGHYKHRDDIHSYFMQTAAYSMMFWERTGHAIADILICMVTPDDGLLLFEEKVKDWLNPFISLRREF